MRIFLTGGTGFIGSHFLREAMDAGHEIVAQRRSGSVSRLILKSEPQWVDRQLDSNFKDVLEGCDAVVHLASHTPNPPYAPLTDCIYWNVFAPIKLMTQAVDCGIKSFLIAGSCFEYGESAEDIDFIEVTTLLKPNLSYPTSKAAASMAFEGFARQEKIFLKILRIFQVYGEGEDSKRLWPSLKRAAFAGEDFSMSPGEQVRDFINVIDVAKQFVFHLSNMETLTGGSPQVVNIGSGNPCTLKEFSLHWWKFWGAQGQINFGDVDYRNSEIMRLVPKII